MVPFLNAKELTEGLGRVKLFKGRYDFRFRYAYQFVVYIAIGVQRLTTTMMVCSDVRRELNLPQRDDFCPRIKIKW